VVSSDNLLTSGGSLGSGYGNNSKWMAVEGQKVYIVTVNDVERTHGQLVLTYSSDGGKTFQQRIIDENSSYNYGRPHVQCDGQMVVIAIECGARNEGTGYPHVFTSLDGGATFTDKLIDTKQKLVDLQVSGRRWAILGNDMYWYYNMHWGNVYLTTSADAGQTVTTQNIAPLVLDNTSWCELNYMKGWNGNAFNYHPQMTLDGNVINVIFQGCAEDQGDPHPTNDRNHTIFRRSTMMQRETGQRIITVRDMQLNVNNRSVTVGGREVNLTAKEFDLLQMFVTNRGTVFSREQMLETVWKYDYAGDARTVDVHIRRLREKIERDTSKPEFIFTKWGVGYYFTDQD
jgi:DNA-binding winged helix-turn-helix (wHTH) protein